MPGMATERSLPPSWESNRIDFLESAADRCSCDDGRSEMMKHLEMALDSATPQDSSLARYGDSDFLISVEGKDPRAAWSIMGELMDTLKIVNLRVYDSVMRKIDNL